MSRERRDTEGISLSFLDVISCGFGALILLLVLTKVFEPIVFDESAAALEGYLRDLEADLAELSGDARVITRDLLEKERIRDETLARLDQVETRMVTTEKEFTAVAQKTQVNNAVQTRLSLARQSLTEEMQRLMANVQRDLDNNKIGGIPVDSEYVIFIIDNSGSMREFAWPLVLQKINETLDLYPRLKGIQIMNDQGHYMFSQYAGDWMPDTQARRTAIVSRLRNWTAFSASNPAPGIVKAVSTYYRPGRKISLYVFGDDFNGRSIQAVIDRVDKVNQSDVEGNRLVRIHAVGFPVIFQQNAAFQATGFRFAHLMRILAERNGGTFIGLDDYRLL